MSFEQAYHLTMKNEGGYSPPREGDPGGETICGISRRWHPYWIGWKFVDQSRNPEKLVHQDFFKGLVKDFYRRVFWNQLKGDRVARVSIPIACELFDSAVNCSTRDAVKFLQEALNFNSLDTLYPDLKVDGIIGEKTFDALSICFNSAQNAERLILKAMNGEQYIFYKSQPHRKKNRGWLERT